jgi:phage terminase large subunit GpA-like protein
MGIALKAFCKAITPPSDMNVVEWACKYVKLPQSARSPNFDIDSTPWLRWPMLQIADDENKEIIVMAPVGSGKTTMLEGVLPWIIAEEPGPTLITMQTDDDARAWVDTRFHPSLKTNDKVEPLLPTGKNRGNFRKGEILFAHMPLHIGGANLANLQSKSIRWVYGDEVWIWKDGMLEEARRRTHDRWNSRVVLVSQGGSEGDQFDGAFQDALIHDYCFKCPSCDERQTYQWKQVKFKHIKNEAEEWDWDEIKKSVHYECANEDCKEKFEDKAEVRRTLSASGEYVSRNNNAKPGRIAATYPAMAVWWIDWSKLVMEWITAQDARKRLNLAPLRQFIQKRLAQSWVEPNETVTLKGATDAYRMAEYFDGQKWEFENFRFMTVDVQQDHFWVVIRAWSIEGKSRLLYEGKIDEWEGLRMLRDRMKVPNRCVFVDRGYRPDTVALECRKSVTADDPNPWNCLLGEEANGYATKIGKRRVIKPFSSIQRARTHTGVYYKYVKFSNLLAKDTLSALMRGEGNGWQIGVDHSKEYLKQMQNEVKREASPGKWRYVVSKPHVGNHLWDCETMQIIAASIYKVFAFDAQVEAE